MALPLVFARLLWRARHNRGYLRAWRQRLGFVPAPRRGGCIWVHAVSVGETVAAAPLIEALLARHELVIVTSTTPTGADRVQRLFGERVDRAFLPFDLPGAVARFVARVQPRLGVIMETEIWPNLFNVCATRAIPLILANARLSARSAKGYRRAGKIIRRSLAAVAYVAAQSPADARRFRMLGVSASRVVVAGNLKYEVALAHDIVQQAQALRTRLGAGLIWLAASTHEGEEALVLDAFTKVRGQYPALRLLLVPRHPERFNGVADLCTGRGWRVSRRSRDWPDATGAHVLLGDSMGELPLFYAIADFAFVGGSLTRVGGHNILEAAALGCPVIIGPHTFNMQELAKTFAQALLTVADSDCLAHAAARLAGDKAERQRLAQRAGELLAAKRGATQQLLALIHSCETVPNGKRVTGEDA